MRPVLGFLALLAVFPLTAGAETPAPVPVAAPASALVPAAQEPVEISAAGSLAWQRGERTYVAEGSVVVVKGDMTLACDRLTAFYGGAGEGVPADVTRLEALGHVHFKAQGHEAFGDKAVYDVVSGTLILTGGDLRLVTPTETVTATERFEYIRPKNRLDAVGYAKAVRGQESLSADRLSAVFVPQANNALELKEIRADNNVIVTTAREKVFGSSGVWDALRQKAVLEGPVRIEQGDSRLLGSRAEVDMKTGQSRLFAAPAGQEGGGRVKGVFFPARKE